jgi:TP901 family phage tail tape measure protein
MANDLKIKIIGTLDKAKTKTEVNQVINDLQGKVNKLNIDIKIDQKILKVLTDFANEIKKIGKNIFTFPNMPNGFQGQQKQLKDLINGYKELNKEIKYYADGSIRTITRTYADNKGNGRKITTNANDEVINYKDIENIAKFEKEQQKLRQTLSDLAKTGKYTTDELRKIGQGINTSTTLRELDNLKSRMANLKIGTSLNAQVDTVKQSLKKMYDQGLVNEKFFNNFNKVINSAKNVGELDKIRNSLQRVNEVAKNQNLQKSLLSQGQSLLGSGSSKLDTAGVTKLVNDLKALNPASKDATRQLNQMKTQMKEFSSQVQTAHNHTLTFGSALKQAFEKFPIWILAANAFYAPIRGLQDMTQRLIEIDTQMTEIKRVMDEPDYKFVDMLQNAVDVSDQLSSKLTDVLNIMGGFGRMGFNDSQLTDITKTAQVLQNISDLDANGAVDTLTSAMLNFNIASKDSITIADKLNEVDNHYAITTKDLADGIRKAAATAKTFGVDLDQLNGYIAAIGSTTRETGTVIGNGLKTVFSRITTMQPSIDALQSIGISIKDMGGNVKPVSDILSELANKWTSLSAEQQQNIGVTIAGRYQLTR